MGTCKSSAAEAPALILIELARHMARLNDAVVRQTLAEVLTHRKLIAWVGARGEALVASGQARGAEGCILTLLSSRQIRRIANLAGSLLGPAFGADTGEWGTFAWSDYLCSTPGLRIAGGTDEIQHNILGERILGLPKEPHLQ